LTPLIDMLSGRPLDIGHCTLEQFEIAGEMFDGLSQFGKELDADEMARLRQLFADARIFADAASAPLPERVAAVRLLGRDPEQVAKDIARLADLLKPQTPAEVQAAAVASLGRLREPAAREALLTNWKSVAPSRR